MGVEATVYILRCADGSYYTGITKQPIDARVWEHNNLPDEKSYVAKRRPAVLVFAETYDRVLDAIARENRSRAGRGGRRRHLSRCATRTSRRSPGGDIWSARHSENSRTLALRGPSA